MPHVVAIVQTKGGAGKTTTAMMLALALTSLGKSVHVIDADKQLSAADWAADTEGELGFTVQPAPTLTAAEKAVSRALGSEYDFILIDTPPGSRAAYEIAVQHADLVLTPTGVSPLDMKRTQATLDALGEFEVPIAVLLVNVNKQEKLLDEAQQALSSHARAALAETIIPTRSATRRAAKTVPNIKTKPFAEWIDLANELLAAF